MRALVIYESMFGNTQQIAQAIADGIARHGEVDLVEVGAAPRPLPPGVDLVVAGGPTHAFGLSRPRTREDARQQQTTATVSRGNGIREWIGELPSGLDGTPVACFDTKMNRPSWLPGSAANSAARLLKRRGIRAAGEPESFYVTGMTGPLVDGELERARRWGERLARQVPSASTRP